MAAAGVSTHAAEVQRAHVLSAMATLVVATPPSAWWLIGDVSEDVVNPDHLIAPPSIPDALELVVGAGATVVAMAALATLVVASRRGAARGTDVGIALPLVLLGGYVALLGRVATAGVTGANIGFGLLVMAGFLFVPAALAAAAISAWVGHRHTATA